MSPCALAVRSHIRRHRLVVAGDRVAVAISGGPDSVALARLLIEISAREAWSVAGLIHVNHGLRGDESDADEAFCRACAVEWRLPVHVARANVAARMRDLRQSMESAARALRYAAFEAGATALAATAVATGHTLDDQAETLMLRLLRGAGSRGLAGIRVRRGIFIRPLLGTRRRDLGLWLDAAGQPYREDASNADRSIPRNRLRHDVLPVLEQFAPRAVPALGRAAAAAADDDIFLESAAIEAAARLVLSKVAGVAGVPGVQRLDSAGLAELPPALSRRVLRSIGASMNAPPWSARHLADLARLAGRERGRLDLPGVSAIRRGPVLELRPRATSLSHEAFDYELPVPGRVEIPEAGAVIEAAAGPIGRIAAGGSSNTAVVSKSCMGASLRVRNRRPGDRFRPLGAPGSRKLQDVLVDRKIPREARDRVPIVVNADGVILWVAGVAVAEACRVTGAESGMVTLKLNPLVGER